MCLLLNMSHVYLSMKIHSLRRMVHMIDEEKPLNFEDDDEPLDFEDEEFTDDKKRMKCTTQLLKMGLVLILPMMERDIFVLKMVIQSKLMSKNISLNNISLFNF